MNYLAQFYSASCDEDARLLSQHGQVEYRTTMRYIERYLAPGMRVLEIGAGTGRYSLTLARMGYDVTAVELVPHNIDVFRGKLTPSDRIELRQGNALDLVCFADHTFDIVLLLGPMYHLYTRKDQSRALAEALRVTKPGGVLFAAYVVDDITVRRTLFGRGLAEDYIADGHVDPLTFRCHSEPQDLFQLYRKDDVEALTADLPAERLHYVAADGPLEFMKPMLDAMPPERFALYMRSHFAVCERPDLAGATNHSLDILRKNEVPHDPGPNR
jgi:ubiquinone/menaquinone biosynthesis C-methylase UbiE